MIVETLSKKYGFDAEEALETLNINVEVTREEKVQKKSTKPQVPKILLPFCNKVIDGCCHGIRPSHGLFTQCTQEPINGKVYCKTCNKHAEENETNKPKNGDINDRVDNANWRSPDGKTPKNYGNIMKKLSITREQALEAANNMNWTIDESQFDVKKGRAGRPKSPETTDTDDEKPKKKRGRPAKTPKKEVVVGGTSGDNIIAGIMANLNLDDDSSSENGDEEHKENTSDDELASQPDMLEAVVSNPVTDIEETPDCEEFEFNGVKYYKDKKTNELFEYGDPEEELAVIGIFNIKKLCIDPIED